MSIQKFDDFISQIGAGVWLQQPIYSNTPVALNSSAFASIAGNINPSHRGSTKLLPNPLPSGVTHYIVTRADLLNSVAVEHLLVKMINFGTFDINANSFTAGSAMPTATEAGVSRVLPSPIFAEVTTQLSFTSTCTLTVTYTNQGGTGSQSTGAISLTTGWVVNTMGMFTLAAGDTGCEQITAVTRGGTPGTPSGVVQFWGVIPICLLGQPTTTVGASENLITGAFNPVRLGAGDQLGVFALGNMASTGSMFGNLFIVGDN